MAVPTPRRWLGFHFGKPPLDRTGFGQFFPNRGSRFFDYCRPEFLGFGGFASNKKLCWAGKSDSKQNVSSPGPS